MCAVAFLSIGDRETFGPRGVCADCTGCPVISVQRWFDRVAFQSFAVLRNVIHVLSARSFVHITKLSMFLVVSVVERPFGVLTFPEPAPHTSRSEHGVKCQDDLEMMFPLTTAMLLLSTQRSPRCSGFKWQSVGVISG